MSKSPKAQSSANDESSPESSNGQSPAPSKPKKAATSKTGRKKAKSSTKKGGAKTARRTTATAKFPRHTVEQALRIPRAIYEQNAGNPATMKEAATFSGGGSVSGAFKVEVSSAKKYGFLEPADRGSVQITERARRAIAPQSPADHLNALREAVLAAPDISDVYNYYRGENLPDEQFFINALADRFTIPQEKIGEFLDIFNNTIRHAELLDETGERPRLLDVGRDESHRTQAVTKRPSPPISETCFVMQPFAGALGGYYDSIFKPAIEQAGLRPMRADADIFGTGKIMDQIWRGIHGSLVLVAELTTKNPNVFYELGLAHALEKPVILVASNQDDVPFDLRHIRVILYDKDDPFWGQKLIDKIADNIKSAIDNPEDAIFRADDTQ